jgi:uncharacterized membrane protein
MSNAGKAWLLYGIVVAGALLWCGLIVAAPLLTAAGGTGAVVGKLIYDLFHPVCHQFDGRSLHIAGERLAVCSRCSAIYAGFLLGLLAYPAFRPVGRPHMPSRTVLLIAVTPMLLDVGLDIIGVHETGLATRLVTGGIFGLLAPYVVMPVVFGALDERQTHQPPNQPQKGSTDA